MTLTVSKTPSPTVSPWSKTLTTASDSSTIRPLTQVLIGLLAVRRRQPYEPPCLELGLRPFPVGVRPPGDAGPGAEPQPALLGPERPDAHRQPLAGVGVDPPDGSAVRPPRAGSRSAIVFTAVDLGAPVTDPGGNVASTRSGHPRPGSSRPVTVETRWTSPG